jgi:hypothetical protein
MTERDDDHLRRLLRASVVSTADIGHERDLWPDVVGRIREPQPVSRVDVLLLAGVLVLLPFFPRAFFFLIHSV